MRSVGKIRFITIKKALIMSHPQTLVIPFPEFTLSATTIQDSSQIMQHESEKSTNICVSHKKIVPLQPNYLGYRQDPINSDLEQLDFTESEDDMAKKTIQSVEPNIADLANGWLKSYKLD